MSYYKYTEEDLDICRNTNLVEVCKSLGYHVKVGPKYSTLEEMDSIRIKNKKTFLRFSNDTYGGPVDFLVQVQGMEWTEAVDWLLAFNGVEKEIKERPVRVRKCVWFEIKKDENGEIKVQPVKKKKPIMQVTEKIKEDEKIFELPQGTKPNRAIAYLCQTRKISIETVQYMIEKGYIYESDVTHNVVFIGRDSSGNARHASLRGTYTAEGHKAYKGVVAGSDARYSFSIVNPKSNILYVTEAPIDAISLFDLSHEYEHEDTMGNYLALTGVHDKALEQFLNDHQYISDVRLLLDADEAGREGCRRIEEKYSSGEWEERKLEISREEPEEGCKDWNEFLVWYKNSLELYGP